jgi:hypothetical protein
MTVAEDTIIAIFDKTVPKNARERVVTVYLTRTQQFDSTDHTFATSLRNLHAHHLDDPAVRHVLTQLDLPDDRQFLAPWAALIGCYHDHPLWPLPKFVRQQIDRAYDELCAEGHIVRRS